MNGQEQRNPQSVAREITSAVRTAAAEVTGRAGRVRKPGDPRDEARRRAVWGVVLIAVGTLFLLDRFGVLEIGRIRDWWPAIVIGIGAVQLVASSHPKQIASGFAIVLWGLWFFACLRHWWGFSWITTWPIALVIVGAEMMLAALLESLRPAKEEGHV